MLNLAEKFNFKEGAYHPADLVNGRRYRIYVIDGKEGLKMLQGKIVDNYKIESLEPEGIERRSITLSFVMGVERTETKNEEMAFHDPSNQEKIEYKKVGYVQQVEF